MSNETTPSFQWPQEFPGVHWMDNQEEAAVLDVLRNGSLFRYYGLKQPHHVDSFERSARDYYGVKYALAVNSGTGALICAFSALGVGPGHEVIVPAFLWVASVGAIVQVGAIPVIAEVDESFNLDPAKLAEKITPRTKVIVAIHMAGSPCDMDSVLSLANSRNIAVLEDCAQCNGGTYRGRKLGTFGAMAIFSLQLNKNITSGEGGLIITNDDRLFERAFSAHDMGMVRKNGRLSQPEDYALSWGQGRRMTELCGAIAGVQMRKLPAIVDRMRASHRRISQGLAEIPGIKLRKLNDAEGDAGPFVMFMVESSELAQQVLLEMRAAGLANAFRIADYGLHIYSNIVALVKKTPLSPAGNPWSSAENRHSVHDYNKGACPQSDALFERSLLLPVPSCLTSDQEKRAVEIVRAALQRQTQPAQAR